MVILFGALSSVPVLAQEQRNAHKRRYADEGERDEGRRHNDGQDEIDAGENGRDAKGDGRNVLNDRRYGQHDEKRPDDSG